MFCDEIIVDINIFNNRPDGSSRTITAENGTVESIDDAIVLHLNDGEIHEIDLSDYDYYRKIKFKTHQIMISMDELMLNRTTESNRTDREMRVPQMIDEITKNNVLVSQIYN